MNDIFESRRRKPDYMETALVAEHTATKIALWCGGVVNRERDRGIDEYLELLVPNVEGTNKAHVNDYVVRKANGRFYVMTMAEMEEYEVMGKRELTRDERNGFVKDVPKEEQGLATPFTPHYVPRGNHPYGNLR